MPKQDTKTRVTRRERDVRAAHQSLTRYVGVDGWAVDCTCGASSSTRYQTRDEAVAAHEQHRARLVGAK